ncbi:hypothetical protein Q1695_010684 [Nippostrongylus brasiliensis]|nr:hypothetical protein Q1695_010684 [Nippostrongylus brasiliensis]
MKVNSIVFLFACLQSYTFIAIVQRDDQSDEYNRFTAPKGADADKAGSNSNSDKSRKTRDNIYVHLDLEKLAEGAAAAMRRISTNATTTTSREEEETKTESVTETTTVMTRKFVLDLQGDRREGGEIKRSVNVEFGDFFKRVKEFIWSLADEEVVQESVPPIGTTGSPKVVIKWYDIIHRFKAWLDNFVEEGLYDGGKNEEFQLLYRDSLGKPCSLEHMGFAEMMSKSGCFRAKEYVDQVCDPFFRCMAGKGNNFFSCEPRICSEYRRAKYRPACKLFVCE